MLQYKTSYQICWSDQTVRRQTRTCPVCLFQEYGDIEYCVIIKNKTTGESKGLGYVRYYKPSQAAQAIENCDKGEIGRNSWCLDLLDGTMMEHGDDEDVVVSLQSHSG